MHMTLNRMVLKRQTDFLKVPYLPIRKTVEEIGILCEKFFILEFYLKNLNLLMSHL